MIRSNGNQTIGIVEQELGTGQVVSFSSATIGLDQVVSGYKVSLTGFVALDQSVVSALDFSKAGESFRVYLNRSDLRELADLLQLVQSTVRAAQPTV